MSWVKNDSHGLLDRFQEVLLQEQYKFNQLDSGLNDYVDSLWIQSERDETNKNLLKVFDEIKEWCGFYPLPIWKVIRVPLNFYKFYTDQEIIIPESAHLQTLGARTVTVIEAAATITPSSGDLPDIGTLTITTDEITDGEVALYHVASDAFDNTADERFRIRPSNIFYNGTAYVIQVPYARFIKPNLWLTQYVGGDILDRQSYDPEDSDNFVTTLDIYRLHNDNTITAQLIGSPPPYSSDDDLQVVDVTALIMDSENSVIRLLDKGTTPTFIPRSVDVFCKIGFPLNTNNEMNSTLEQIIIRKARADMGLNSRLAAAKITTMWEFDNLPAYTPPDSNDGRSGIDYTKNPIGSRNIDIEFFKSLLPLANHRGKINDMRFWR